MNVILNEIDTEGIREDSFRGNDYLVAPVTAMKAMDLDGGYVPREHVRKSVPAWNGTPVTLNHPVTADGERVSANSPKVAEKTWLGYFFNAESVNNGERLDGEVWLDVTYAEDRESVQQIHENLRDGKAYATSTAYFGDDLGSGEYDGEFRENAVGNLKPDHLALLTNSDGRCSMDDGCMIGAPATNSEMKFYPYENRLSEARTPTYDGTSTRSWPDGGPSLSDYLSEMDEDASQWNELSQEARNEIASRTLLGDPEADSTEEGISYPVVFPNGDLSEDALRSAHSLAGQADEAESSIKSVTESLLEEEFDVDMSENAEPEEIGEEAAESFINKVTDYFSVDTMTERDEMIEVLVNQHDFKKESLEGMGDTCLERTYESFESEEEQTPETNSGEEETPDSENEQEEPTYSEEDVEKIVEQRVNETVDEAVESALEAYRETEEREELVEKIVTNSDDYERDDLEETPVSVLENLAENVEDSGSANWAASPGASARTNESDDFPAISISEVDE